MLYSYLSSCDKIADKSNLGEEEVILAHRYQDTVRHSLERL